MSPFGFFVLVASLHNVFAFPSCVVESKARVPCNPAKLGSSPLQKVYTADTCIAAGCCWMKSLHPLDLKKDCYESVDVTEFGYELQNFEANDNGFVGTLQLISSGNNVYGADIPNLSLQILTISEEIVEVKIADAKEARWEIPESIFSRPSIQTISSMSQQYSVQYTEKPFSLQIIRKIDGEVIFNLDSYLIFKDQYLEFSLLSNNTARQTYGYGESARVSQALEVNRMYTLWAEDLPSMFLSENLYGSLPFCLQQIASPSSPNNGKAHGHILLNSNGMDVTILSDRINHKVLGGIIDFYVFIGSTAKKVIQQSTEIIGKPMMIPYWSLGFHNCKWGYENIQQIEEIVLNYSKANIPLDTQWFDIDYMSQYRDFTLNETAYETNEVQSFISQLHSNGQRLVPIIDPGILVQAGYEAYDKGKELDLFIKDIQGNDYIGQVWPGPTHYPDFLHPKTQDYWTDQLTKFHSLVDYDGLWMDMNEVSNFCNKDGTGQICANEAPETCHSMSSECCLICHTIDETNKYDFPNYHINTFYGRISGKTLSMSTKQYNNISVYNSHNLYGLTEQIATNNAIKQIIKKRPFLLTRSSFLSTGKYSAKWSGDNISSWYSLKASIISMLDYNIFSIPMTGSDICGFIQDTTEELCARWIALGSFYPFSRNHNAKDGKPQELYLWDTVTQSAQKALAVRYQLLPYYYTLFYHAHIEGIPVIQSLWMNFPNDPQVRDIDQQFLVGGSVLVSPVTERGARSVKAYFPQGIWYEFSSKRVFLNNNNDIGVWKVLPSNITDHQVHIAGGVILPLQQAAMTTTVGRKTPFTYLVALSNQYEADGSLYWDDGEQMDLNHYLYLQMHASYDMEAKLGKLTVSPVVNSWFDANANTVGAVEILSPGGMTTPKVVKVNHRVLGREQWEYNHVSGSIMIHGLEVLLNQPLEVSWE